MKYRLMELIECPECHGDLKLQVFDRKKVNGWDAGEVVCKWWCYRSDCQPEDVEAGACVECFADDVTAGHLQCQRCDADFPVIDSIPRLLPVELLWRTISGSHQDFLDEYGGKFKIRDKSARLDKRRLKTQKMFGYQWTTFRNNFEYFKDIFLSFVNPYLKPADFENKLVLEIGCGSGRPACVASSFGAEVIGVDLSEAVQTVQSMTQQYPGLHVVQGDAYSLPFKARFDLVYSVGVLQHIADPQRALKQMARLIHKDAFIVLWVYGVRELWYQPIEWMRKVMSRSPFWALHIVSTVLAVLSEIFLLMPYRILSRFAWTRNLAECIPGRIYSRFPFRENVLGWFDRLGAPVTYYFSRKVILGMMKEAGFDSVDIVAREGASASWVLRANREEEMPASLETTRKTEELK